MQEGGGLDPRIPKLYNTWGLWLIVYQIYGFEGPWRALGGLDDKVMVQVVNFCHVQPILFYNHFDMIPLKYTYKANS